MRNVLLPSLAFRTWGQAVPLVQLADLEKIWLPVVKRKLGLASSTPTDSYNIPSLDPGGAAPALPSGPDDARDGASPPARAECAEAARFLPRHDDARAPARHPATRLLCLVPRSASQVRPGRCAQRGPSLPISRRPSRPTSPWYFRRMRATPPPASNSSSATDRTPPFRPQSGARVQRSARWARELDAMWAQMTPETRRSYLQPRMPATACRKRYLGAMDVLSRPADTLRTVGDSCPQARRGLPIRASPSRPLLGAETAANRICSALSPPPPTLRAPQTTPTRRATSPLPHARRQRRRLTYLPEPGRPLSSTPSRSRSPPPPPPALPTSASPSSPPHHPPRHPSDSAYQQQHPDPTFWTCINNASDATISTDGSVQDLAPWRLMRAVVVHGLGLVPRAKFFGACDGPGISSTRLEALAIAPTSARLTIRTDSANCVHALEKTEPHHVHDTGRRRRTTLQVA